MYTVILFNLQTIVIFFRAGASTSVNVVALLRNFDIPYNNNTLNQTFILSFFDENGVLNLELLPFYQEMK